MTELGEAFVPIRATLDKLDGDLADAKGMIEKALGGLGEGLQKAGTIALGVGAAGFAALGTAMAFSLDQALGNEKIQASLAQAIKASGGAAGLTAEMANDLAQSFIGLAGGSDDAVLAIETVGIRAGTIAADEMPAFIQASLDLGAVMGDTAGAAQLLARAQEDPIAAMGRLQRSGIVFTEDLKKQIAAMVKSGDAAGATALLMDRVAEATGGAAAANAGTLAGQWEILKGQLGEAAETIGGPLLTFGHELFDNVIGPAIPIITGLASAFAGLIEDLAAGGDISKSFSQFSDAFEEWPAIQQVVKDVGQALEDAGTVITGTIIPAIADLAAQVKPYVEQAAAWLASNVNLQDVLIALGAAIMAVVIPAIATVVSAAAPVIVAFVAVMAVAALLRHAWEEDWGGIQEKTAAAWAVIQPLLAQAVEWLSVEVPLALERLRSFWVETAWPAIQRAVEIMWPVVLAIFDAYKHYVTDIFIPTIAALHNFWVNVAWPAIQRAVEIVWPIVQTIFAAISGFITGTLIPTVSTLYAQWTTIWWPAISTALTNAWTVIETVFKEVDRWINKNIIPWINLLKKVWTEEVWPAIHDALTKAWAIIKPIWEAFQKWLDDTLPKATTGLQTAFETAMTAIHQAVEPVKTLWDLFAKAVSDFWNWITSHTFSFQLHIPDLPDWAVPGSPLPIHTAWKDFAGELNRLTIAPRFDLDSLLPVMGLVGEDGGPARSVTYSSTTHVNTNRDPMRVLRASRHLDKLGAMT